jgi:DNA invertase Pin-like site-specific DNA recombinase
MFFFVVSLSNSPAHLPKGKGNFEAPRLRDHIEDLGGEGPKVAAYLRVSTPKQAKEGFSLDAQYEQLCKLKSTLKPSCIHWFIDPGKSASRDFDKRKMNAILQLREGGEIEELWVWDVSRMGRECRRLLYFFLDFCDNGAKIITPKCEYSLKDLASLITFIIDAHSAEKANKDRAAAAVAGKAQSFKQKHWNKTVPLGYLKRVWLEKNTSFEALIQEVHSLFSSTRSIEFVRQHVNKKFTQLLAKPLSRSAIRRILSDPVYVGKPEHLGEIVADTSLAFIDEETFQNSLNILARFHDRYRPNRIGPLEQLATSQPVVFLEMLDIFELHHRGCGGLVRKNGTTHDEGLWQQLLKCKACPAEWRLPPIKQRDESRFRNASEGNSMGKLVFDNGLAQKKKARNTSDKDASPNKHLARSLVDFTEVS